MPKCRWHNLECHELEMGNVPTSPPLSEADTMALADVEEEVGEPDQPKPGPIVLEIRVRMAKLDLVDEIVGTVHSMLVTVRGVPKT